MSRRGGGSVNPFARTVQATGGQPNQNQRQQQQPQYSAPRGPPSGGGNQGGRNPFAQQAHSGSMFQQQQQVPPQQQQPRGQLFQKGQQQSNRPNQAGNPFAQSSGGMSRESSSMELDGSMADTRGNQFGGQQSQFQQRGGQANNVFGQPRPQQQQQRSPQHGAGNPFAPSAGSNMAQAGPAAGRNPFAPAAQHPQAGGFMQQPSGMGMHNQPHAQQQGNPFAQPSTGHMFQSQQAPQQQQQQQGSYFNQGFQQQSAAQPTSFFTAGGGAGAATRNAGAGFAPPPKAVVNAATLSAVNVSAALAPSKVDDIDLGLGLAPPPVPPPIVTTATPPAVQTHSSASSSATGQPIQGTDESSLQQEIAALLTQILKDSPATSVSELAPTHDPYALMTVNGKLELVAGRVPAVAPPRQTHKPHHNALFGASAGIVGHGGNVVGLAGAQGASRNPFFSAR
jgi:hypothetical protein